MAAATFFASLQESGRVSLHRALKLTRQNFGFSSPAWSKQASSWDRSIGLDYKSRMKGTALCQATVHSLTPAKIVRSAFHTIFLVIGYKDWYASGYAPFRDSFAFQRILDFGQLVRVTGVLPGLEAVVRAGVRLPVPEERSSLWGCFPRFSSVPLDLSS